MIKCIALISQNNEDDLSADKIASLKAFLDRPAHHIVRLFQRIYDVLVATPESHSDHWQTKCTAESKYTNRYWYRNLSLQVDVGPIYLQMERSNNFRIVCHVDTVHTMMRTDGHLW